MGGGNEPPKKIAAAVPPPEGGRGAGRSAPHLTRPARVKNGPRRIASATAGGWQTCAGCCAGETDPSGGRKTRR